MVIVIIGILATLSTATYGGMIEKAENGKITALLKQSITDVLALRVGIEAGTNNNTELMNAEFDLIDQVITLARKKEKKTLAEITGESCSDCICRDETFLTPYNTIEQECIDRWDNLTTLFKNVTDLNIDFIETDPWGSPYFIDENEGEQSGNYCRQDNIFSAGPDKTHQVDSETETVIDGFQRSVSFYDTAQCGS